MTDITYSNVDNDMSCIQNKYLNTSYQTGFIKANDVVLPVCYKKFGQCIEDLDVRDDDIWVCGFPKTGTTWCQEMTWCIGNDLDFKDAKQELFERFPVLELRALRDYEKIILDKPDIEIPRSYTWPETQKTLAFHYFTIQSRLVHIKEILKNFVHCLPPILSLDNKVCYSPFFDHILGYWDRRDDSQVLFLKYEDMKQDQRSVIRRTAQFLGKDMLDDQLLVLEDHLSFESMKKNRAVNQESFVEIYSKAINGSRGKGSFARSGIVGEGKTKMTPEFVKIFDEWEDKCLEKSDLKFL